MFPTVRRARGNVDDSALKNHHHMLHVFMLEIASIILLLLSKKQNGIFQKTERI